MASLVKWLFGAGARGVDGEPVASGSAYFYVPGSTSEEITVYADPTELEVLTQPVALDAAGRAEVYAKVQFEIKVLDALGATVLLSENASTTHDTQVMCSWAGITQSLYNALGDIQTGFSGSNTGSVSYKESDSTGAVNRTYFDVVHDRISPFDFNAAWDDSTNDAVALQRAINRAIATGLPLVLPPGTCKVSAGLTINGPITILGPGKDLCSIEATAEGFDLLTIDAGASPAGVHLANFCLEIPWTAGTDVAVYVTRAASATFERLLLRAFVGIGGVAANFRRCLIANCHAVLPAANAIGFGLGEDCTAVACSAATAGGAVGKGFTAIGGGTLVGCEANGVATGFQLSATDVALGCTALSCGTDAALADGARSFGCSWVVTGNLTEALINVTTGGTVLNAMTLHGPSGDGIKIVAFQLGVTAANPSVDCTLTGEAAFATDIGNVQVTKCSADGTGVHAILNPGAVANKVTITVAGVAAAALVSVTLMGY